MLCAFIIITSLMLSNVIKKILHTSDLNFFPHSTHLLQINIMPKKIYFKHHLSLTLINFSHTPTNHDHQPNLIKKNTTTSY